MPKRNPASPVKTPNDPLARRNAIRDLIDRGVSHSEIGRRLGITRQTVSNYAVRIDASREIKHSTKAEEIQVLSSIFKLSSQQLLDELQDKQIKSHSTLLAIVKDSHDRLNSYRTNEAGHSLLNQLFGSVKPQLLAVTLGPTHVNPPVTQPPVDIPVQPSSD